MEIIVDDREKALFGELKQSETLTSDIAIKIERLTVGDYAIIINGKIVAIIERKTLNDLSESIKDDRMKNIDNMIKARKESKCKLLLLVEGNFLSADSKKKYRGIPYKNLQAKLDHIAIRDDIPIVYTKDPYHTIARIIGLCKSFHKLIQKGELIMEDIKGGSEVAKVKIVKPNDRIHVEMIAVLDKCGITTATNILKKYHIKQVFSGKITEQQFREIHQNEKTTLGDRGSHVFKQVSALMKHKPGTYTDRKTEQFRITSLASRILSKIKGITPDGAEDILKKVSFPTIIQGTYRKGDIASAPRREKPKSNKPKRPRKVGNSAENRINMIFNVNTPTPALEHKEKKITINHKK